MEARSRSGFRVLNTFIAVPQADVFWPDAGEMKSVSEDVDALD